MVRCLSGISGLEFRHIFGTNSLAKITRKGTVPPMKKFVQEHNTWPPEAASFRL